MFIEEHAEINSFNMSDTDILTYVTFDLLVNGHHRLITNRVQSAVQFIILINILSIALDLQSQAKPI